MSLQRPPALPDNRASKKNCVERPYKNRRRITMSTRKILQHLTLYDIAYDWLCKKYSRMEPPIHLKAFYKFSKQS